MKRKIEPKRVKSKEFRRRHSASEKGKERMWAWNNLKKAKECGMHIEGKASRKINE